MKASDFTDEDIQEIARAGHEADPLGRFDQSDITCAVRHLNAKDGGASRFGAAVYARARQILLRKQQQAPQHTAAEIDEVALAGFAACYPVKDWDAIGEYAQSSWRDVARSALAGKHFGDIGDKPTYAAMVAKAAEVTARRAAAKAGVTAVGVEIDWAQIDAILSGKSRAPIAPAPARFEVVVGCDYQHTAPDPTRDPLDAMLRFVCGHPQGARWLGERDHADVRRLARAFRPDHPVEHKSCEPLASCLLTKLSKLPGTTLARWLSIDEQREYNRLHSALKAAVAGVRP